MKNVLLVLAQFTALSTLFVLLASPAKADIEVRVHLIDARTGKPIVKKPVRIWVMDAPNRPFRADYLEEKTDSTGVATFIVSDPLPEHVAIRIGMGGYWEDCSSRGQTALYAVREILDSGISRKGACSPPGLPKKALAFLPKPREVYLFAAHLNLWEWVRYCGRRDGCGD